MRPQRIVPGPGQESVWDYPRPPAVVPSSEHVRVVHHGIVIADTTAAIRILETSQPPGYYIPPADVAMEHLRAGTTRTFCEWKGVAEYWTVQVLGAPTLVDAGWSYASPVPAYVAITGHVGFYPQRVDECWVDDERVEANEGNFYGGWITSKVVGPFKGASGTLGW